MSIPWLKLLKFGLPILLVLGLGYCVYDSGSEAGKAKVQAQWDKQKLADAALVEKVKKENAAKEAAHNKQDQKINDQLSNLKVDHAKSLADIRIMDARRLSDSSKRESMYRVAAEGSASERASLASHAAELDRLLAESIGLLQEGGAIIELRDGQIVQLAAQIKNDRQLIDGSETQNGTADSVPLQ